MRHFLALLLAPISIAASPAIDAETTKDVRCLVAVASLANSEDESAKMAAIVGSQYFLGRIDGRQPTLDLETAIRTEAARLDEAAIKGLLLSCGGLMKSRGAALQSIGEGMQDHPSQSSSSS